ncbi:MAG: gamma-glutamylcyclotransferase [Synechococcaceae cyanobacterium SM2_3_2]|nr:gamma-glutamylcyclotransferase [Synechococcaceae cyanobacterium SM2_3_2]
MSGSGALMEASWTDVFVYGTLLKGESNHAYLKDGIPSGADRLTGFQMFDLGSFPMIVPISPSSLRGIVGERYRIPIKILSRLDELEDHPHFYRRQWLTLDSGTEAWVYVGQAALTKGSRLLAGGDWRARGSI